MSHKQERQEHEEKLAAIKARFAPSPEEEIKATDSMPTKEAKIRRKEERLSKLRLEVSRYAGPRGLSMAEANELGRLGLHDVGPPPAETAEGKKDADFASQLRALKAKHAGDPPALRLAVALLIPRLNANFAKAEDLVPDLFEEEREQARKDEEARERAKELKDREREEIAAARRKLAGMEKDDAEAAAAKPAPAVDKPTRGRKS